MGKSNKRYTVHTIMLVFAALFTSCFVQAMDEPTGKDAPIYVATSDGQVKRVERWKIDQMKTLLVFLNNQKSINSQANPLQAAMITSQELDVLNNAWDAIMNGAFDGFYNQMAGGAQASTPSSISGSSLSFLIEAAEKVQAQAISAFCLSRVVPLEVQKNVLVPHLIEPFINSVPLKPLHILNAQSQFVSCVVFSPDGRYVLVCGLDDDRDKDVFLWDFVENTFTYLESFGCNTSAAWSPDGKYIVMGGPGDQDNLCLFDVTTKQSRMLIGHPSIGRVAFSPNSDFFVTGSLIDNQNNVIVWSVITGAPLMSMRHPDQVSSLAWSPDGKSIAAGGKNNLIVWDAVTGKQRISIETLLARAVAWSPDSSCIVSGGESQKAVIVWDAVTGEWRTSMEHRHDRPYGVVNSIVWRDEYIVSGRGASLIMWNAKTGMQMKIGEGHPHSISSVAFSPNGEYIVSGCRGSEKNLILWPLLSRAAKEALRSCSFVQAQLLYRLIVAAIKDPQLQLESSDLQIFNSLPQKIKNILQERFAISSPVGMGMPIKCPPGKQGDCVIF